MPSKSRDTANASPDGSTCTSSDALDTSIPTKISIRSRPCTGLTARPKRQSGLKGETAGDPCWTTGLETLRAGIPPDAAPPTRHDPAKLRHKGMLRTHSVALSGGVFIQQRQRSKTWPSPHGYRTGAALRAQLQPPVVHFEFERVTDLEAITISSATDSGTWRWTSPRRLLPSHQHVDAT